MATASSGASSSGLGADLALGPRSSLSSVFFSAYAVPDSSDVAATDVIPFGAIFVPGPFWGGERGKGGGGLLVCARSTFSPGPRVFCFV